VAWNLQNDRPIYLQLMEVIKLRIVTGQYPCGERLPAVRELAFEASVNPNTMQKALSELERENYVFSQRTSGRFITEDKEMIARMKETLAQHEIALFIEKMAALGYEKQQIIALMDAAEDKEESV